MSETPEQHIAENETIITGSLLEGKSLAGIATVDIASFKKYFSDKGITDFEIYTFVDNPHGLSLLVCGPTVSQYEVFDELFKVKNEEFKGGFWSDSVVDASTMLRKE